MKVYLELPTQSRGLQRVYDALIRYKPDRVEVTKDPSAADLHILHVIGRHDHVERKIESLKGKQYAMIQYCVRSTMNPEAEDWVHMWQDSKLVWSYYDLPKICEEECAGTMLSPIPFPFYHSPLGADSEIFYERETSQGRRFIVLGMSQHALSESVRECAIASKNLEKTMLHIGHNLRREYTLNKENIDDNMLAYYYSKSQFVSGLRRDEGFELPAAEGILCGARPILFDKPHYRKWFDGLAEFIKETDRDGVIKQLEELFRYGARPVTEAEKAFARVKFNWEIIIKNFWLRLYENT